MNDLEENEDVKYLKINIEKEVVFYSNIYIKVPGGFNIENKKHHELLKLKDINLKDQEWEEDENDVNIYVAHAVSENEGERNNALDLTDIRLPKFVDPNQLTLFEVI